jgi:hypothetical protein
VEDGVKPSFSVDFAEHPASLCGEIPLVAELASNTRAKVEVKAHAHHARRAALAQRLYKRWMRVAGACIFLTLVLGASSMAAAIAVGGFGTSGVSVGKPLSVGAALSAACGAVALYKLREGRLLESWMAARARAETHRLSYFSVLGDLAAARPEPQRLASFLVYFQRFHLDVQREFYDVRAREHEASANVTVTIGAVGAGMATFFGALGAAAEGGWAAVGVLSVAGAALGAVAATRELMNDDRRNSERCGRTWAALQGLAARLDEVREAAAAGNADAVKEFVSAVNDQVSLEHRQWLEGSENASATLSRLEDALSDPGGKRVASGRVAQNTSAAGGGMMPYTR